MYALKLFCNVCALVDLTLCGQSTNLLVRSKNGPEHVANVNHVRSLTFISQVTTHSIVLCETQHNNADWNCFKTLTLREILKIRTRLQMERCVFLAVTCLFQEVGCVRIRHQFHTVQQSLKIISLDAGLRMDGILRA